MISCVRTCEYVSVVLAEIELRGRLDSLYLCAVRCGVWGVATERRSKRRILKLNSVRQLSTQRRCGVELGQAGWKEWNGMGEQTNECMNGDFLWPQWKDAKRTNQQEEKKEREG